MSSSAAFNVNESVGVVVKLIISVPLKIKFVKIGSN
jgi:hypothetical protein